MTGPLRSGPFPVKWDGVLMHLDFNSVWLLMWAKLIERVPNSNIYRKVTNAQS